jgi:nicotinate-nucleotide adenylyltransferase
MKIALFGSAFNPPSIGHADCIAQLAQFVDEVWLIPSFHHAFDKEMSPYALRCDWVKAFAEDLGSHVKMMAVEHEMANEIDTQRAIYSYEVVEWILKHHGAHQFVLAIGPDNMHAWARFSHTDRIHAVCQVMVAQERLPVRSTGIRQELGRGYVPSAMLTPNVNKALTLYNPWKPLYVA